MDRARKTTAAALVAWGGLILIAWTWGNHLNASLPEDMFVQAPPLTAHFGWSAPPSILWAVAFAALVIALGPRLVLALGWRPLLVVAALSALSWSLVLVNGDGTHHLLSSVTSPLDYLSAVRHVDAPGEFLASFVDRIGTYGAHVRSHPPGLVLLLWSMDRVGLDGPLPAAALYVTGGALAVPAVMIAVREVADEVAARALAPFMTLAPAAVWVATSADALFAGVAAWGCTLLILATGRAGGKRDLLSLGGGLILGLAMFMSYGLVLMALVPATVIVARRAWRVALVGLVPVVGVGALFALAGFWWLEGLMATRVQYLASVARFRPYGYFLLANLAAFALAVGPATAAGLARLRERRLWWLVGGALAGVAIADLSGMSKAEVERIWLPFAVWVMVATIPLARARSVRWWLAAQAGLGLILQVGVRSPW